MEILWLESAEDLTTMTTRPKTARRRPAPAAPRHPRDRCSDTPRATLTLGRDAQNDVVIADRLASRQHARIERRRDKFVRRRSELERDDIRDGRRANREVQLRREEMMLRGSGPYQLRHDAHESDESMTLVFNVIAGDASRREAPCLRRQPASDREIRCQPSAVADAVQVLAAEWCAVEIRREFAARRVETATGRSAVSHGALDAPSEKHAWPSWH